MRVGRLFLWFVLVLSSSPGLNSQQSVPAAQRDQQAIALLQSSLRAMGGTVPSDSVASGNVVIVAGSLTTSGTVRILTRGTNQTSIQFQTPNVNWSVIYSNGQANRVDATGPTMLPLELAASSQSLYFPFPFLSSLLNNPDFSLQYVGQESLDSSQVNHISVQNTFASSPSLQSLSDFTIADIWLDASTALPVKIAMIRRFGGGSSPKIPFSVVYSNYQTVSGIKYPFAIQEYITETLWATTNVQSVAFNTGLSDSTFQVSIGGN
jgi:hypothetical protein